MVQSKWNMAAIIQECEQNQKKLFMCLAEDTIDEDLWLSKLHQNVGRTVMKRVVYQTWWSCQLE